MKPNPFHRLHSLRMENDAHRATMEEQAPRFAALASRHENGTAPRAVSAFQLFQTPPSLAHRLADLLPSRQGMRILEPSAGLGRLLDALHNFEPAEVVAVEMAAECAREIFTQDRADIRHVLHARQFLAPGGILAALVMDTSHREKSLQPLASTWEKIPAGAFRSEGTSVPTVMLSIRA